MTYAELEKMRAGRSLPLYAETADGDDVIVGWYVNSDVSIGECYVLETIQDNGWTRFNYYWKDGTVEETYKKTDSDRLE